MESSSSKEPDYRLKFLEAKKSSKFSNSDLLGVLTIVTLAAEALVLIVQILLFTSYSSLSSKPVPTLVQLSSGDAIQVAPLGSKERTPEVIMKFTSNVMSLLMSWSGTIPNESGGESIADKGVEIRTDGARSRVTTTAYQAAFALSEDFRKEFLAELGQLTPSGVFGGTTKVVFVPLEVQKPVQIEAGKWKVQIVANLLVFDQSDIVGKAIPFNKEVFVRAVELTEYQPNLQGIALAIQQMRSSGLEVYAIRDLIKDNL